MNLPSKYYVALILLMIASVFWLIVFGVWAFERNYPTAYRFDLREEDVRQLSDAGIALWCILQFAFLADAAVALLLGTHANIQTSLEKLDTGARGANGGATTDEEGDVGNGGEKEKGAAEADVEEAGTAAPAVFIESDTGRKLSAMEYKEIIVDKRNAAKTAEIAITCVAAVVIIICSTYILGIYCAMLNDCGKFVFCCDDPTKFVLLGSNRTRFTETCDTTVRGDFLAQFIFVIFGWVMGFAAAVFTIVIATEKTEKSKTHRT